MKTLSVKEVAGALGMTPRGVVQRLNKGQLKGTRKPNQFGVQEWSVYATKEIVQALEIKKNGGQYVAPGQVNFSPEEAEAIEAEEISCGESEEPDEPTSWREIELERLELMAEKLVKPLTERLEAQAVELREQEKEIEEQRRQLRLLPDLQKRAEEERKAAEIKALEVEALHKQIAALDEQRRAAETEAERFKAEKEVESSAIKDQLACLTNKLEKLEKPWWKKWFSTGE